MRALMVLDVASVDFTSGVLSTHILQMAPAA